jgi:hypothetical protein
MGADLYIRNLFAENQAKYEPRFYQAALERDQLLRVHNNLKHPRVVSGIIIPLEICLAPWGSPGGRI